MYILLLKWHLALADIIFDDDDDDENGCKRDVTLEEKKRKLNDKKWEMMMSMSI